ncbi:nucleoporin protein Ndc1-Nup [Apodospora peruviana]|uniref:Nucleoporin protein Ndc1-Nup n=1 Tax=Apodospora peruviana TaxID=516989 RepID=A0AAE0M183_9PEZI|nr:nucleoporin protein Ndc1-Nup [Apodospora peruviana]
MASTTVRRLPYKDFLQPTLHKRFAVPIWGLLALSYFEAIALSRWDSFWWVWFPVGPTGARTVFLTLSALSIVILHIAQYHAGLRTSDSGFQTFVQHALKLQTAEAIVSYVFSAFIFSQVYLWSVPNNAGLEWITYFSADRARLNEKAVFFTVHFFILGLLGAFLHLFKDLDYLSFAVKSQRPRDATALWKAFLEKLPSVLVSALNHSLTGLALSTIIYSLFLRSTIWRTLLFFLRPIYSLPRTNMVPVSLPFSLRSLVRCWTASLMLLLVWTAANIIFTMFIAQEPLKNGKPLTSESKDPNGSLLSGLKSKKLNIRAFAFWELALIARNFPERRVAIYQDIERTGGPAWAQIYAICTDMLKGMESRIDSFGKPPQPPAPVTAAPAIEKQRTTQPPKEEAIFTKTLQKNYFRNEVEKVVNDLATAPGQGSQLSPMAKKAMETAKQQLLQAQKMATGSDDTQGLVREMALKVLKSSFGWPFRQEYHRRVSKVVLGSPFGEPSLLINATTALGQLATHSLTEDKFGNVQRDVATIIRTLTAVTKKLETFKKTVYAHWTDVSSTQECPKVDSVLAAMKHTLGELVDEFGPYARDLRLSMTDMRLAREAAGPLDGAAVGL